MQHTKQFTSNFPVALIVAVKASLDLDGFRAATGRLDAAAIAHDMLDRRPDLSHDLVNAAVQSRLSEDPLHRLA